MENVYGNIFELLLYDNLCEYRILFPDNFKLYTSFEVWLVCPVIFVTISLMANLATKSKDNDNVYLQFSLSYD